MARASPPRACGYRAVEIVLLHRSSSRRSQDHLDGEAKARTQNQRQDRAPDPLKRPGARKAPTATLGPQGRPSPGHEPSEEVNQCADAGGHADHEAAGNTSRRIARHDQHHQRDFEKRLPARATQNRAGGDDAPSAGNPRTRYLTVLPRWRSL